MRRSSIMTPGLQRGSACCVAGEWHGGCSLLVDFLCAELSSGPRICRPLPPPHPHPLLSLPLCTWCGSETNLLLTHSSRHHRSPVTIQGTFSSETAQQIHHQCPKPDVYRQDGRNPSLPRLEVLRSGDMASSPLLI